MKKQASIPLLALRNEKFLHELHHFLWQSPHVNREVPDQGWNCRDHAWILAMLANWIGFRAAIFHGEACLILGTRGEKPGIELQQKPHSWVGIDDLGIFDLSINPSIYQPSQSWVIPIKCIYASDWFPKGRGDAFFLRDPNVFSEMISRQRDKRGKASAVYLIERGEELDQGHIEMAADWINSPLTDELRERYGGPTDLYAALFIYLTERLLEREQSIATLSQWVAWDVLAERRHDSVEVALHRVQQNLSLLKPSVQQVTAGDVKTTTRVDRP